MATTTAAIRVRHIRCRFCSRGLLPLTPALSPEERESPCPALACSSDLRFAGQLATIPPLPRGEGRGEGEGDVRQPTGHDSMKLLCHRNTAERRRARGSDD